MDDVQKTGNSPNLTENGNFQVNWKVCGKFPGKMVDKQEFPQIDLNLENFSLTRSHMESFQVKLMTTRKLTGNFANLTEKR